MSNLSLRLISGSLYVIMVALAIYFEQPFTTILITLFSLLALMEMIGHRDESGGRSTQFTALVYAGLIIYLCLFEQVDPLTYEYWIAFGVQLLSIVLAYRDLQKGKQASLLFLTLYLWLPLASLALWCVQNPDIYTHHLWFFFICIWSYDSMAYVVGKWIGKNPIFPKISPKKTIEGTLGGLLLTLAIVVVLDAIWLNLKAPAIVLGMVVVLTSVLGDLFESFYKRKLGIKDSGNMMPGHGGILDRIDSILFAALPYILVLSLY